MNREARIGDELRNHPGVREAAVVSDARRIIHAFVVPDDTYVEEVLGYRNAELSALSKWRKIYDLTQFAKDAASAPAGFNTSGWNSSYTRKPIPVEEMQEWLQTTVVDILSLEPKSVYEVGCGTGMLLTAISPHCDRYVGVDFAAAVVKRLKEQLWKSSLLADRVQVIERTADNFEGLDQNSFDTVLINSVVQYFPSVSYLTKVLESAIDIVKEGGQIFVGDVPNLTLLPAFASSIAISQVADEMSVRELRDQIQRRIQIESQLILSPAYFTWLQTRCPRISNVEIHLRRDRSDNEMSKYRYHAILHLGQENNTHSAFSFLDWTDYEWELNEIRSMLQLHPKEGTGIKRIRNSRLVKDLAMLEKLRTADPAHTVRLLRNDGDQNVRLGIHPQDLIDLGHELNYKVSLSWKACRSDGSYDAVFTPTESPEPTNCAAIHWPMPDYLDRVRFANAPGQNKFRNELIDQLLAHCKQNLPEDMVPGGVILVDTLGCAGDSTVDPQTLLAGGTEYL